LEGIRFENIDIFYYSHLEYFTDIWVCSFGTLSQEKSGYPALQQSRKVGVIKAFGSDNVSASEGKVGLALFMRFRFPLS
jgi:hypothetical protein